MLKNTYLDKSHGPFSTEANIWGCAKFKDGFLTGLEMALLQPIDPGSAAERRRGLMISAILFVIIALANRLIVPNVAVGFLYIFPVMLAAPFLPRIWIVLFALLCTAMREMLGPVSFDSQTLPLAATMMLSFCGAGLFIRELAQNRSAAVRNLQEVEQQIRLREQAEAQVKVLVDSSPMAILIVDWKGKILSANAAAHRTLGTAESSFDLEPIDSFLPVLAKFQRKGMPSGVFRTDLETKGRRRSGQVFIAHLWLSTFKMGSEIRLAVMIADESEELREREETALRQLLWNSRLMMGAVSHEMRNLCGAIGIVHANLRRVPSLEKNEDFQAFGELLEGLRSVVAAELRLASEGRIARVQLAPVFENVRIVVEPSFQDAGAELVWKTPPALPQVWGEPQGLTQVFLNLCQNSCRVLETAPRRRLTVTTLVEPARVLIKFQDTGPGVSNPDRLFQPFQEGATVTGIGLYVSRAIIRSFGGKLQHEASDKGACFTVELARAEDDPEAAE